MICFKLIYDSLRFFIIICVVKKQRNAFVMNNYKSLRKILESNTPKTDACGTPKISSKKVLCTMLILTDCFLFLGFE